MSWKAFFRGRKFYFFSILGGWGGWVRGEMENSIFFFFFLFDTFPKAATEYNSWLHILVDDDVQQLFERDFYLLNNVQKFTNFRRKS